MLRCQRLTDALHRQRIMHVAGEDLGSQWESFLHLLFRACIMCSWRIKERALWPTCRIVALQMRTQLHPAILLTRGKITQIRNDSLPRSAGRTIRLDKRPIRVSLAAVSSLASSQEQRSTPSLGCFEGRRREDKNLSTRSAPQRHSGNGALSLQPLRSINGPKNRHNGREVRNLG